MPAAPRVRWPKEFRPLHTPLHVANEMTMEAETRAVWAVLTEPKRWPDIWPEAEEVTLERDAPLERGSRFSWRAFGMKMAAQVEEFVPEKRLAWKQTGFGIRAYHVWLLRERPDGTYVRTEESLDGFRPRWSRRLDQKTMQKAHQLWLEGLQRAGIEKAHEMKAEEERRAIEKLEADRARREAERAAKQAQYEAERRWAEEQLAARRRAAEEKALREGTPLPPAEPAPVSLPPEDDDEGWDE
jgi:hypothetical protein